jgi:dTDP-4-amino-4,6-dideoxygalactose transaminase
MTINLFHLENYVVDTSKFHHVLHDEIVTTFEKEFADYVGAKYACSISSATNAIFLMFNNHQAVVNVPSVIPPVVLNAIINGGNKINFVDDVSWIGDSYVLHQFDNYKIIDSAQKVSRNQFKEEANPQDLMFFSFYPTKPVGGIDGGMIVSDDYDKILNFKELVLNGMSYAKNNWERKIKFPGWKMYMNSFQAYVARENFKKLPEKLEALKEVRKFYNQELGYNNTSDHLYRISTENNKEALSQMKEKGITCGIHYDAMHLNDIYRSHSPSEDIACPLSEKEAKITLSIPYNEKLKTSELEYIVKSIGEIK